jgi:hypothetical protein
LLAEKMLAAVPPSSFELGSDKRPACVGFVHWAPAKLRKDVFSSARNQRSTCFRQIISCLCVILDIDREQTTLILKGECSPFFSRTSGR